MTRKPLDKLQNAFFGKISRSEWVKLILEQGTPKRFLERQLLFLGILFKDWCDGTKNDLDLNGYSSDISLDLIPSF